MENWFLCQTKSRDEFTAKLNLERQGYETYLPTQDNEALFPGYIFVKVDGNFAPIKSTRGVLSLVAFGQQLATVPQRLIDQFRKTEWQRSEDCKTGSLVRVTSGPFNYREAIVKAKKADRIIVLMDILNRETELELKLNQVEAA